MCWRTRYREHWLPFAKQFFWSAAAWAPVYIAGTDLFATVIRVEGQSMHPTLNGDPYFTDRILVEKVSYKWLHKYSRGDVALLWAPDDPGQLLIKRLVAVEGDVVWHAYDDTSAAVKIPKGRCWVEGDNADQSGDSRSMYGPVHLGLLEGRATHVVWPPWRWGRVSDWAAAEERLIHKEAAAAR